MYDFQLIYVLVDESSKNFLHTSRENLRILTINNILKQVKFIIIFFNEKDIQPHHITMKKKINFYHKSYHSGFRLGSKIFTFKDWWKETFL